MMNRRHFLNALGIGAAGLILPRKSFFLPPAGGWRPEVISVTIPMHASFGWSQETIVSVSFEVDGVWHRAKDVNFNYDGNLECGMPQGVHPRLIKVL